MHSARHRLLQVFVALAATVLTLRAGAASVVIELLSDPKPPQTVREMDAGDRPPRIADPLSLALLFNYSDLHRPERLEAMLRFAGVVVDSSDLLQMRNVSWSKEHIANQRSLGAAVRAYRRGQQDVFARQEAIDRYRADLIERGRQMAEAAEILVPITLVLKPYDPSNSAFPAARFLQNPPKSRSAVEELGAICSKESSGRDQKLYCVIFENIRPVTRPSKYLRGQTEILEDAPLGYIPFDDRNEAKGFAQALASGRIAATYLLVAPLGKPQRMSPDASWKRSIDGVLRVRATRLVFTDSAGEVVKSFVIPERPVASDGLPIKLPGNAQSGRPGGSHSKPSPEGQDKPGPTRPPVVRKPSVPPKKGDPQAPALPPVMVTPK